MDDFVVRYALSRPLIRLVLICIWLVKNTSRRQPKLGLPKFIVVIRQSFGKIDGNKPFIMPYVFVRENAIKYWCVVQGLSHNEMRVLAEKVQDQPEVHDDKQKRAEFSLPTWLILNALEVMGFKVSFEFIRVFSILELSYIILLLDN